MNITRRWYHRPLVRRCALALAAWLMDAGHRVDVFAWSWPTDAEDVAVLAGKPETRQ